MEVDGLKNVIVSRAQIMEGPSSMFLQGFEYLIKGASERKKHAWNELTTIVNKANRTRSYQGIEEKIQPLLEAEFNLVCFSAGEYSPKELSLLRIAQDNNPEGRRAAREWFAKMKAYYSQGASRKGIEGDEAHSRAIACELAGAVLAQEKRGG